ncbi:hypothetical protein CBR_g409 [Chara braunii]|uniref:Uncharacterized protein n=1 Tax=Chara braunii TaxID=69332 RepID=A0A388JQM9_CHABU|nr:hypothetical protein CBR_g409 [Chara braunii]|eukprot:GBG60078.1 hypothetical protein CBR_g409 [Chara braunii]
MQVPISALPQLESAVADAFESVLKAHPAFKEPGKPELLNVRFDLVLSAGMRYKPCLMIDHLDDGYAEIDVICADTPWCENCRRYFHKSADCPSKRQPDRSASNGPSKDQSRSRSKSKKSENTDKSSGAEKGDKGRIAQGDNQLNEKEKGRVLDKRAEKFKPPHPPPPQEQGGGRAIVVWKKKDPNPSERRKGLHYSPHKEPMTKMSAIEKEKGSEHETKAGLDGTINPPPENQTHQKPDVGTKDVEMTSEGENINMGNGEELVDKGKEDFEDMEDSEKDDDGSEEEEEEEEEQEDEEVEEEEEEEKDKDQGNHESDGEENGDEENEEEDKERLSRGGRGDKDEYGKDEPYDGQSFGKGRKGNKKTADPPQGSEPDPSYRSARTGSGQTIGYCLAFRQISQSYKKAGAMWP